MTSALWLQIVLWLGFAAIIVLLVAKIVRWYSKRVVENVLREEKMYYDQTKINIHASQKSKQASPQKKGNPWFKHSRS